MWNLETMEGQRSERTISVVSLVRHITEA
uniref:Uncharacterized protein n=1 Tax=Arundo donax TaxID=35708 RepID=A0A0A9BK60_ARUDO